MTQDEIRRHLQANDIVHTQIAAAGDGSPQVAWGDTFFFVRGEDDKPGNMPFATIVTKDYEGFDIASQLNRGGLFRLNVEIGKRRFEQLFGFRPVALTGHRQQFDFTALDQVFPHPIYGVQGWISIINPSAHSRATVMDLLDFSLRRAWGKSVLRTGS